MLIRSGIRYPVCNGRKTEADWREVGSGVSGSYFSPHPGAIFRPYFYIQLKELKKFIQS